MSGAQIAELANMALAEIGHRQSASDNSTPEYPFRVIGLAGDGDVFQRAVYLAKLKVEGPHAGAVCPRHAYQNFRHVCRGVSVAEALLGVHCGAER